MRQKKEGSTSQESKTTKETSRKSTRRRNILQRIALFAGIGTGLAGVAVGGGYAAHQVDQPQPEPLPITGIPIETTNTTLLQQKYGASSNIGKDIIEEFNQPIEIGIVYYVDPKIPGKATERIFLEQDHRITELTPSSGTKLVEISSDPDTRLADIQFGNENPIVMEVFQPGESSNYIQQTPIPTTNKQQLAQILSQPTPYTP